VVIGTPHGRIITLAVLASCIAACGPTETRIDTVAVARARRDSAAVHAVTRQRDQADSLVRTLSLLVAQVDSEIALARTGGLIVQQPCESGANCARPEYAQLRAQVRTLVGRLSDTEARLRAASSAQGAATRHDSTSRAQTIQLRVSVDSLTRQRDRQLLALDSLRTQVKVILGKDSVTTKLVAVLEAKVDSAATADDSVFIIAASKAELLRMGVVELRGGSFFAFGRGKTLVPVANPTRKEWQPLSKKRDSMFVLPRADRWYAVVSAHPVALLRGDRSAGDQRGGTIHFGSPRQLWATSRYLILEEQ
jgi:hypothetical protein